MSSSFEFVVAKMRLPACLHRVAQHIPRQSNTALGDAAEVGNGNYSGDPPRGVKFKRSEAKEADWKLAPANLAAGGTRASLHLMFRHLETQFGKVEYLPGFKHRRYGQESAAGNISTRRAMCLYLSSYGNLKQALSGEAHGYWFSG